VNVRIYFDGRFAAETHISPTTALACILFELLCLTTSSLAADMRIICVLRCEQCELHHTRVNCFRPAQSEPPWSMLLMRLLRGLSEKDSVPAVNEPINSTTARHRTFVAEMELTRGGGAGRRCPSSDITRR